ncbi:hypothetical protein [Halarcobacter sp.]|uniref:hypothetical protein n=1 Tax=Halarcobacter sp. TaxID=2321133 RepID=UPI003AFF961F
MEEWCVYIDKIVTDKKCNIEHIIPKSIGGHNKFTIKVEKEKNSKLGRELDCKITDHPIMLMMRQKYNLRGYSKKPIKYIWNATVNGLEGSLDLRNRNIIFNTYRGLNEYGLNVSKKITNETISTKISYDENILVSFGAKMALGIGKYLYQDIFKCYGFHNELRNLMNSKESLRKLKSFQLDSNKKKFWIVTPMKYIDSRVQNHFEPWMNAILSQDDKHVIFTLHTQSEIVLGISLFGSPLNTWLCNIGRKCLEFPIGGDFELGRVIEIDLNSKEFLEVDLRTYLVEYSKRINPIEV